MKVIKPPTPLPTKIKNGIFLAGSIDQGKAVDWQTQIENSLEDKDVTILNPRRPDWDSTWVQSIDNKKFREQVEWELNALEQSKLIVMYFDPKGQAPISLLELGLHVKTHKMIVCCPGGYWRKGNVDIVCKRYNVPQVDSLDKLVKVCKNIKIN